MNARQPLAVEIVRRNKWTHPRALAMMLGGPLQKKPTFERLSRRVQNILIKYGYVWRDGWQRICAHPTCLAIPEEGRTYCTRRCANADRQRRSRPMGRAEKLVKQGSPGR